MTLGMPSGSCVWRTGGCDSSTSRMSSTSSSAGCFTGPDFCLIFAPVGYDEPEILTSQTPQNVSRARPADMAWPEWKHAEVGATAELVSFSTPRPERSPVRGEETGFQIEQFCVTWITVTGELWCQYYADIGNARHTEGHQSPGTGERHENESSRIPYHSA